MRSGRAPRHAALVSAPPAHAPAFPTQVIDLCAELQSRGLSPSDAERVLDSGLSLRLSVWVAATCAAEGAGGGGSPRGGARPGARPLLQPPPASLQRQEPWAPASPPRQPEQQGPQPRAADYAYGLQLDDGRSERFSFESHVRSASSYQFYSGRRQLPEGSGWLRCEHVVPACPRGARRASVLLRGRGAVGAAGARPAVRFGSVELAFVPAGGG